MSKNCLSSSPFPAAVFHLLFGFDCGYFCISHVIKPPLKTVSAVSQYTVRRTVCIVVLYFFIHVTQME